MITPELLDLTALPSLPLSHRRLLPETAGIYFAIDSADQIQYIGCSVNIRNRWLGHHRKPELEIAGNVRIAWVEIEDLTLLSEVEQICIDHFDPPLNGSRVQIDRTQLNVRLDGKKELLADIRKAAAAEGLNVNAWVVRTLEQAVANFIPQSQPITRLQKMKTSINDFREFIPLRYIDRLKWSEQIGERLEKIRGNISRRELAERLRAKGINCTHQGIQQMETGETTSIDIDFAIAVCREFGQGLDYLVPVLSNCH